MSRSERTRRGFRLGWLLGRSPFALTSLLPRPWGSSSLLVGTGGCRPTGVSGVPAVLRLSRNTARSVWPAACRPQGPAYAQQAPGLGAGSQSVCSTGLNSGASPWLPNSVNCACCPRGPVGSWAMPASL